MKIASGTSIAALSVLFICGAGAAQAQMDPTGRKDLGVDISRAGSTPAANQKFLESLTIEQQGNVRESCLAVTNGPKQHAPQVVAFCTNLTM